MADVIPFMCWRPRKDLAEMVAAAPYDTFSRTEARAEITAHPLSFLRIDKPAALFGDDVGEYDPLVYEQARKELDSWYEQGIVIPDSVPLAPAYFVYRLSKEHHRQIGVVACASVAEYENGVIKRHENTRMQKEEDRIEHIRALEAHTGPVLLTYPSSMELDTLLANIASSNEPLNDFVASDGVRHELWRVDDSSLIESIRNCFASVPSLYIADGHHRAAAAASIARIYAESKGGSCEDETEPGSSIGTSGLTDADYFLVALFGSEELQVLDYNRVVSDLGNQTPASLLAALAQLMCLEPQGNTPYRPMQRGEVSMYLEGTWYKLSLNEDQRPVDAVDGLDVAILHDNILAPLLSIDDPRSNPRISYVGGARGLEELSRRVDKTGGVAFALYPCSLEELFAVADEGRLMPPKSTWFDPKPRSGLAIHRIFEEREAGKSIT